MKQLIAIEVDGVSKTFRVPHERISSLKQSAINLFRKKRYTEYRALQDVSFSVKKGEFFGIVGKNGSGKSTLLKIIADIYAVDQGKIKINGRLSPFIELGVGFNPELSGRENIFLNGALLGMSRKEIARKFDAIVRFAELEAFIDQKLKNYSSGMQVRLAFSVAIQAEADILLIDEVLAVGDIDFQRKCFEVFMSYKHDPEKTVIFVTHDMSAAERFCDRIAVINDSRLIHCGETSKAVELYYHLNALSEEKRALAKDGDTTQDSSMEDCHCVAADGSKQYLFSVGQAVAVELELSKPVPKHLQGVGFALFKEDGSYCFGGNTFVDKVALQPGSSRIRYTLPDTSLLLPGKYFFKVGLFATTDADVIEFNDNAAEFRLEGESQYHGTTNLPHTWSIQ